MNIDETINRQKKSKLKYGKNRLAVFSNSSRFITKTNGRSRHTQSTSITTGKAVSLKKAGSVTVSKGHKAINESDNGVAVSNQTAISEAEIAEPQIQKPPGYKVQHQQLKITIELQSTFSGEGSYTSKSISANSDNWRVVGGVFEVAWYFLSTRIATNDNNEPVAEEEETVRWIPFPRAYEGFSLGVGKSLIKSNAIYESAYSYIVSVYDMSNSIIDQQEFTRNENRTENTLIDYCSFGDGVTYKNYEIRQGKITQTTQGYSLGGSSYLSQITTSDLFTVGYIPLFNFIQKDIIFETDFETGNNYFTRNNETSVVCALNMRNKKIEILTNSQTEAMSRLYQVNMKRQPLRKNITTALDRNFERYSNPNYNDITEGLVKEYNPPARAVFLSFYENTPDASDIVKPVMMDNQSWGGVNNIGVSDQRINPTPKAQSFQKSVVYNKVLDDTTFNESSSFEVSYTEEEITTLEGDYPLSDPVKQTDASNYRQGYQKREFLSSHFLDNINPRPIQVRGDKPRLNTQTRGLYATNKRGHIKKSRVL